MVFCCCNHYWARLFVADKNFDELIERMQTRVYAGAKGKLRLALLQYQLEKACTDLSPTARVLDCGVGQGHLACALAEKGYSVSGIDISAAMLQSAEALLTERALELPLQQASIEDFSAASKQNYDLLCCHAVIEWSDQPERNVQAMARMIAPGGYLSLMFYNPEALVWRNLLKGNFYRAQKVDEPGQGGGLTPQHMLSLEEVEAMCGRVGLNVTARYGVRVIHDYLTPVIAKSRSEEDTLAMEIWLCDREPHWRFGRYLHLVLQKA